MFSPKEKPKYQRELENELNRALTRLRAEMPNSEDYEKMLKLVERLHDMMDEQKPEVVSKNTLLTVSGNLLGIILILKHERFEPITSKALSFVIRTRT
jgi:hypothetical protein